MRRLIVNADDFGLHEAVNRGIYEAHTRGIVMSASLMAGGAAFENAVDVARSCPELGVGVHLTLVGGRPVLPPQEVSTLVDAQGRFCASYPVFLARYLTGRVNLAEVEQELTAQIEKMRLAGIAPTHIDSHQHLHVLPGIGELVLALARRFSIRAIRIPAEPVAFLGGMLPSPGRFGGRFGLTLLANLFRQHCLAAGFAVTQHFFGMLAGGRMNEILLQKIIQTLPKGDSEIMVHPGADSQVLASEYSWGYHWEEEMQALVLPGIRDMLKMKAVQLISFREL
jgi:chitin disaccharide deacetylase